MLPNKSDQISEHLNNSSASSFQQQKSFHEDFSRKGGLFPNSHWISKKDEKKVHKRNNMPCKRWGHSVILFENQMFLFGGSGNNSNARNWETIYILNCDTYDWEKVCPNDALGTNTPEPRDSHACVRIGNSMYIFGGSNGENPLNDMFAFNLVSKTWNKIDTSGETPSAREGHSGVALHDRYFFIFGGWDGKNIFPNCYLFDCITKKWKMIEYAAGTEPLPRESHSCALLQDHIYIFGGQGTSIKKKDTYYNDLFRFKVNVDKSLERVSGVWTKLSSKSGHYPSPRTSHSIAAYKDRYLIVIGGEGYSTNNEGANVEDKNVEQTENGKKETPEKKNPEPIEEPNEDDEDDEENHPPCFPKSDIWIYDIEESSWNSLETRNTELFLPRFTHSCAVYKDSLIIFGGLKDFKNSIDDLMVLALEDTDTKKPIHLCSCCKKMLDSDQNQEAQHPVDNGKLGSELKKAFSEELEIELVEFTANSKPFISLSYFPDILNLIRCPFASFGLFLDCALMVGSRRILFRWEKKSKFGYNPNRVALKEIDNFIVAEFDGEISKEAAGENIFKEEQNELFYKNLKYAGLRLGHSILYVRKGSNDVVELYYVSTMLKNNPDLNDFIVFYCSWNSRTKEELSPSFIQFKKSILDNISYVLCEDDLLKLTSQNTLFILDLRKLTFKNQKVLELALKNDDICVNVPKILEKNNCPAVFGLPVDYSLKSYLEHFFMVPSKEKIEIYLNEKKITFFETVPSPYNYKEENMQTSEQLQPFSKTINFFSVISDPEQKKEEEKEEHKMEIEHPIPKIIEKSRDFTSVLLYQNNRFVQKLGDFSLGKKHSGFTFLGLLELDSEFALDFSKCNIENLSARLCFLSCLNDFLKRLKEEKFRSYRIKLLDEKLKTDEIEMEVLEPPLRKVFNNSSRCPGLE